jgi:nitrate reductase gamma subunit
MMSPKTLGKSVIFRTTMPTAVRMYASAMNGTTTCVTCAILFTPPKMINPRIVTTTIAADNFV